MGFHCGKHIDFECRGDMNRIKTASFVQRLTNRLPTHIKGRTKSLNQRIH